MKTKYIIVEDRESGLEFPVLFSEFMVHRAVAEKFGYHVIAAGFCYINDSGEYECYGESTSLKIKSRLEDSRLLNETMVY